MQEEASTSSSQISTSICLMYKNRILFLIYITQRHDILFGISRLSDQHPFYWNEWFKIPALFSSCEMIILSFLVVFKLGFVKTLLPRFHHSKLTSFRFFISCTMNNKYKYQSTPSFIQFQNFIIIHSTPRFYNLFKKMLCYNIKDNFKKFQWLIISKIYSTQQDLIIFFSNKMLF